VYLIANGKQYSVKVKNGVAISFKEGHKQEQLIRQMIAIRR
jgi:hypothetical protein